MSVSIVYFVRLYEGSGGIRQIYDTICKGRKRGHLVAKKNQPTPPEDISTMAEDPRSDRELQDTTEGNKHTHV